MGFDDIPQASLVRPSLTTIRQPLEQMGRIAAQVLFDILKNPDHKHNRIELPTEIILRESTATLRKLQEEEPDLIRFH
jgi:LacI family transcriptional regulator